MIFGEGKYFLGRCKENLRTKKRKIFGEEKIFILEEKEKKEGKKLLKAKYFLEENKNREGKGGNY